MILIDTQHVEGSLNHNPPKLRALGEYKCIYSKEKQQILLSLENFYAFYKSYKSCQTPLDVTQKLSDTFWCHTKVVLQKLSDSLGCHTKVVTQKLSYKICQTPLGVIQKLSDFSVCHTKVVRQPLVSHKSCLTKFVRLFWLSCRSCHVL